MADQFKHTYKKQNKKKHLVFINDVNFYYYNFIRNFVI